MSSDKSRIADGDMLRMTTNVVSAYVGNNEVQPQQLAEVIKSVYGSLAGVGKAEPVAPAGPAKPAVPIKRSITPEYIVCLEDGRRLKMLKRHLRTAFGMSVDQYRHKWGLPADYPMVAPNYAKQRSVFAKRIGLGRRGLGPVKGAAH